MADNSSSSRRRKIADTWFSAPIDYEKMPMKYIYLHFKYFKALLYFAIAHFGLFVALSGLSRLLYFFVYPSSSILGNLFHLFLGIIIAMQFSPYVRNKIIVGLPDSLKIFLYKTSLSELLTSKSNWSGYYSLMLASPFLDKSEFNKLIRELPLECQATFKPGMVHFLPSPLAEIMSDVDPDVAMGSRSPNISFLSSNIYSPRNIRSSCRSNLLGITNLSASDRVVSNSNSNSNSSNSNSDMYNNINFNNSISDTSNSNNTSNFNSNNNNNNNNDSNGNRNNNFVDLSNSDSNSSNIDCQGDNVDINTKIALSILQSAKNTAAELANSVCEPMLRDTYSRYFGWINRISDAKRRCVSTLLLQSESVSTTDVGGLGSSLVVTSKSLAKLSFSGVLIFYLPNILRRVVTFRNSRKRRDFGLLANKHGGVVGFIKSYWGNSLEIIVKGVEYVLSSSLVTWGLKSSGASVFSISTSILGLRYLLGNDESVTGDNSSSSSSSSGNNSREMYNVSDCNSCSSSSNSNNNINSNINFVNIGNSSCSTNRNSSAGGGSCDKKAINISIKKSEDENEDEDDAIIFANRQTAVEDDSSVSDGNTNCFSDSNSISNSNTSSNSIANNNNNNNSSSKNNNSNNNNNNNSNNNNNGNNKNNNSVVSSLRWPRVSNFFSAVISRIQDRRTYIMLLFLAALNVFRIKYLSHIRRKSTTRGMKLENLSIQEDASNWLLNYVKSIISSIRAVGSRQKSALK